ncbi:MULTISPECIES: GNAT family N-acetyltransferase [Halorussus]|uniref:lipid II:glycine glycyltransferase FemX n=1 Tax=Halorussus TaxID=1070314 RepID=UPI000E214C1B|nr:MULTISPECIES: GNAT family N-acetyltransferase [Halorussus]NHN61418.1 GNAT family N-acetyltransferase [Halorussus sp. JP-T4]
MSLDVRGVDTIESVNRNQWNQVVENAAVGRVYHRYGWQRAIERGTRYEPRHLVVEKKGNPVGLFPNFVTESDGLPVKHLSSPKPGPAGPIAMTDEEAVIDALLDAVPAVCDDDVISNQVQTSGPEFSRYHELFREHGYRQRLIYGDFTLDIGRDWEEILAGMDKSRRQAIRRANDREYEIVDREVTEETMAEFYEGFSSVMDRVGGRKTPRRFWLELADFDDRLKLLTLRADGGDRGTILLTLDDERSTLHYESSAITEEHFEYNPSELLHEHAIKWGQEHGYDTYNFGGTDLDFRDGVFRFKEQFGARPMPALAWERGVSPLKWPAYRLGRRLSGPVSSLKSELAAALSL